MIIPAPNVPRCNNSEPARARMRSELSASGARRRALASLSPSRYKFLRLPRWVSLYIIASSLKVGRFVALPLLGSDFEKADFHVAGPRRDAHVSPRERRYDLAGFRPTAGRYRRQGPHLGPDLPPSACHSSATSRAPQRSTITPRIDFPASRRHDEFGRGSGHDGAAARHAPSDGMSVGRPGRPCPHRVLCPWRRLEPPRSYQREVTRSTISCSGSSVRPRSRCLPWISIAKSASCERGSPAAHAEIALGGAVVQREPCGITGSRRVGVAHDGDDAGPGQAGEPRAGGCRRGWEKESCCQGDGEKQAYHRQEWEAKEWRRYGRIRSSAASGLVTGRDEGHVCVARRAPFEGSRFPSEFP